MDLAQRVPQGFVYAIDPSESVIQKARQHAAEKGVNNIRFEVGDIFNWKALDGVEEASFDIVHVHQVLQHLQDPLNALKEMRRLTTPGGIVAVREVDYSAMTWYPEIPGLRKWSDLYLNVAHSIGCDPNIGKRLHAVAMEAGFERKDIEASGDIWVFSTPEEREWWCGLWAERTVQSEFKSKVLEKGLGTVEDLEAAAESFRELERREDGWFSVMNGQVICHVRGS